jgi:hypothetical protein
LSFLISPNILLVGDPVKYLSIWTFLKIQDIYF